MISNLHFHISRPTAAGYLDQAVVWKQFQEENATKRPFDVIHMESVGLRYTRSKNLNNLAVSWHGIAYETIHSDIIQELLRNTTEDPASAHALTERLKKVIAEPDVSKGDDFRSKIKIAELKSLILGLAGRLVEDKGHPLMFEALQQIFKENSTFRDNVIVLVAGNGPWGARYKGLRSNNVMVLGPLEQDSIT
ncbi:hypothetical protein K7X08_022268 [Anisodus acutangulus]|uniref:Uncharacterized protein n=1 Tax=Anisodus acutangulus TaxID=402998 RepID=A0A9Q1MHM3_9SOLA|nr:hypothetical protein K7X08_022268 [Anisodus acutangulus]